MPVGAKATEARQNCAHQQREHAKDDSKAFRLDIMIAIGGFQKAFEIRRQAKAAGLFSDDASPCRLGGVQYAEQIDAQGARQAGEAIRHGCEGEKQRNDVLQRIATVLQLSVPAGPIHGRFSFAIRIEAVRNGWMDFSILLTDADKASVLSRL